MDEQEKKQSDSVSLEEVISTIGKLAEAVKKIGEKQDDFDKGFSDHRKVINKELESLRRDAQKSKSDSSKEKDEDEDKPKKTEKIEKTEDIESKLEQYKKNLRLAEKLRIADAKDDVMKIKGALTPEDEVEIYKIAKKADTDEEFDDYLKDHLTVVREKAKKERQRKIEEAEKLVEAEKKSEEEKNKIEQAEKLKNSPNQDKTSTTSQQTSPKYQDLVKKRRELAFEGKQGTEEYKTINDELIKMSFPDFSLKEKTE